MSEKMVHGGFILSGGSIILSGILIVYTIMKMNAGEEVGCILLILPVLAVLLVAGVAAIIYGSRREQ